jgi:putative nucleotidyltransferase with HDIG domain
MTRLHPALNALKISGNLPSMPQILVQLIDRCHEPEINLSEIAGIIDKDTAISAKLLQLANSAFIGARRSFLNVEQAVVYLGADTIRNLVISLSVQQVFQRIKSTDQASISRFWYHSLANALIARNIALTAAYNNPSEAYLAGLLHDIGKLLLHVAFPDTYAPFFHKSSHLQNDHLIVLEEKKFNINHCAAGAWLCEEWRLPTLLTDAVRYHHHTLEEVEQALPLTRIAYLANLLSHNTTDNGEHCLEAADRLFGLSPEQVCSLYNGVEEQIKLLANQLGIRISQQDTASHKQAAKRTGSQEEVHQNPADQNRRILLISDLLNALLTAEKPEQVLAAVEQGLKRLLNVSAFLIMVLDRESGDLTGVTTPNSTLPREFNNLTFSPQQYANSLPGNALVHQRLMHFFTTEQGKEPIRPLDARLLHMLGTKGMLGVPMVYKSEIQGLLLIGFNDAGICESGTHWEPLHLLANHAALCFYLNHLQALQAEQLAVERIRTADMTAKRFINEINDPLTTLRNHLQTAEKKYEHGQAINRDLAVLNEKCDRLDQVLLELMARSAE